ncbi:hypothetical protein Aperf_G00000020378 [Anoplocephala perfoliata]
MANVSIRGSINRSLSIKQGLFIGGAVVGGCVIIVALVICCFCSAQTSETNKVKSVKATKKSREVKEKLEVVPETSPNPLQNPQANQGEARGVGGETSTALQGKKVHFLFNNDSGKKNAVMNSTSSVLNNPQPSVTGFNVPAYAKVRQDGASAFYSDVNSH